MPLDADPRRAFEVYVSQLEAEYLPWYRRAINVNFWAWQVAQMVTLLAGFGAAVLAGVVEPSMLRGYSTERVALVVLPLLASLASAFLGQMRPREIMVLRDAGRETIENLIAEAQAEYPTLVDTEAITAYHRELVRRVSALEQSQLATFAKVSGSREAAGTPAN